jgi:hypothetical protein
MRTHFTLSLYKDQAAKEDLHSFIASIPAEGETYDDAIDNAENKIRGEFAHYPDRKIVDIIAPTEYAVLRNDQSKRAIWRHDRDGFMEFLSLDKAVRRSIKSYVPPKKAVLAAPNPVKEAIKTMGASEIITQNEVDELFSQK